MVYQDVNFFRLSQWTVAYIYFTLSTINSIIYLQPWESVLKTLYTNTILLLFL